MVMMKCLAAAVAIHYEAGTVMTGSMEKLASIKVKMASIIYLVIREKISCEGRVIQIISMAAKVTMIW